jgi:uncharacterized protein YhaN
MRMIGRHADALMVLTAAVLFLPARCATWAPAEPAPRWSTPLLELSANHSELGPINELLDGILQQLTTQESDDARILAMKQQRLVDAESRLQHAAAMLTAHRSKVDNSAQLWEDEKQKIEEEAARLRSEIAALASELGAVTC